MKCILNQLETLILFTDTLFFEHAHPIAEPPRYIICFMNNYEKVCKK